MSQIEDISLPGLVSQTNKLPYQYADGNGIDYEPFRTFLSISEADRWFRAWTGNPNADASCFRLFGQDGSGGYVGFWTIRKNADILSQPIVFLGSEGEIAVLARNFYDYLWLLAAGLGPCEAVSFSGEHRMAQPELESFAIKNAPPARTAVQVLETAKHEFPGFGDYIESQCR
jgi:hypothetical protein